MRNATQVTGNVGLYFVCYHLSRLGWNAMPTSRNAKGIDILAYSRDCTRILSLQVKTLSKRAPVPLGRNVDRLLGDFWVIVNNVERVPGVFVMEPKEVRARSHRGEVDGRVSYWLQPKSYQSSEFHLYAGIATDVRRRYQEHVSGGPKAARYLRAHPPRDLVFRRRIGSRSLALKVEYRFKRLPRRNKEAIIEAGKLRMNRETGEIRR